MSYNINLSNGTTLVPGGLSDGTVDTTHTSLTLIGRDYAGYGAFLNENFVYLLENFSNTSSPANPLKGQLWWDLNNNVLRVWSGQSWKISTGATSSKSTNPPSDLSGLGGDLWFDTDNQQLKVYSGTGWITVGPATTPATGNTGATAQVMVDTTGGSHNVLQFTINGVVYAILSKDTFSSTLAGFSTVKSGLNFSTIASPPMVLSTQDVNATASTLVQRDSAGSINVNTLNAAIVTASSAVNAPSIAASSGISGTLTGNVTAITVGATSIAAQSVNASTGFTGPLLTAAQPNVTSLGTLTGLSVSGTTTTATLNSTSTTNLSGTTNITGTATLNGLNIATAGVASFSAINNTIIGNTTPAAGTFTNLIATSNIVASAGTVSTSITTGALVVVGGAGISGNVNIGGNTNVGNISVSGNIVASGNINATGNINSSGNINATGNVVATGNIISNANTFNASRIGAISLGALTYADGNVLAVFQSSVNSYNQVVVQNSNSGSLASASLLVNNDQGSAGAYYTELGMNSSGFTGVGSFSLPNASYLASASSDLVIGTYSSNAIRFVINSGTKDSMIVAANGAVLATTVLAATSTSTGALQITSGGASIASGNIYIGGSGGNSIVATGNINVSGNILPFAANGVYNIGSTVQWFNTFYGVSTQAQYADLAERYAADDVYPAGTVVMIGGSAEITAVTKDSSSDVLGVISTNAAYLMNSSAGNDLTHPAVAMAGRVPVRVVGSVNRGDRLVSAGSGCARAASSSEITPWTVIGRALESKSSPNEALVLAVVRVNI
jgi:hypothetical protein